MFQNGLGLTIRTANPKSLWDYIWESSLSKGCLRLRSGGAYFRKVLSEFYVRYFFPFTFVNLEVPGGQLTVMT